MKNVLIIGGSGFIGTPLTLLLEANGYCVAWLTRTPRKQKFFLWNIEKNELDLEALAWADVLLNVSGESLAQGRWTRKRKHDILSSRVDGLTLIHQKLQQVQKRPKVFISASAVGYYGTEPHLNGYAEDALPGNDFLATVCVAWEHSIAAFASDGMRVVTLRLGVVISPQGGMLKQLLLPARMGLYVVFGRGNNVLPWIHVNDLINMFLYCIENTSAQGVYNAVAPNVTTQFAFVKNLKGNRWGVILKIPSVVVTLLFGEMSVLLLEGVAINTNKIQEAGFVFKHPHCN